MKPIKIKKKLRFHKETIADLHSKEMEAAHGGKVPFTVPYCPGITNYSLYVYCCL
jgi:hypothetical protein